MMRTSFTQLGTFAIAAIGSSAALSSAALITYGFEGATAADQRKGTSDTPNASAGDVATSGFTFQTQSGNYVASSVNYPRFTEGARSAFAGNDATNATNRNDLEGAITASDYWSFTITPQTGYSLDISSVSFAHVEGHNAIGARFYLLSSVGGFASSSSLGSLAGPGSNNTYTPINLGSAFDDIQSAVEFRIYAADESTNGSDPRRVAIDNVRFTFTATEVPEPTSLLSVACLGMLCLRRRR
jgi:hypothetical protein